MGVRLARAKRRFDGVRIRFASWRLPGQESPAPEQEQHTTNHDILPKFIVESGVGAALSLHSCRTLPGDTGIVPRASFGCVLFGCVL
jgi:hypothetical protein